MLESPSDQDEQRAFATRRRRRRWVELSSIVLLSCAGVATSWSSYQAARWSGVQSTTYSRANALRLESTRASSAADQLRAIDIAMFASWAEAYAGGEPALREFYENRFRDEFEPAFRAWLETHPIANASAPKNPFQLPEYRLAKTAEAAALARRADEVFAAGQEANRLSDAYVLNAVLFATVLFFAGIAQQFRVPLVPAALLACAGTLLIVGGWNLLTLPRT